MRVSVLIPTYGRPEYLKRCIDSLVKQTRLPDEIILITMEDDLNTQSAIKNIKTNFKAGILLKEERVFRRNIVQAENKGLAGSTGEIICLIDDDACAADNWIKDILQHYLNDAKVGAAGGPVIPMIEDKPVLEYTDIFAKISWYGKRITASTKIPRLVQEADFLRGCNMSFRRRLTAGFDENLLPYWRRFEDDLCFSIKEQGYKIIVDPKLRVFHYQAQENKKYLVDNTPRTIIGLHHNSIYVKIKHLKGVNRIACIIYEFSWGDDTTPGILAIILYGIKHCQPGKLREAVFVLAGKLKGILTYLKLIFKNALPA